MVILRHHQSDSDCTKNSHMNQVVSRGRALLLLACLSVLVGATPALAQETWTPELMICGVDPTDPTAWIWKMPGAVVQCVNNLPTFVMGDDYLEQNPTAAYLNQPNDFVEVIKPQVGSTPAGYHLVHMTILCAV